MVNLLVLPLVGGLAILVTRSLFGFFLQGFIVWIHEFGHATVAWMTGKRALPLPIGWTNLSPDKSYFVYFGILLLLGLLFATGWRERKIWPMIFAGAIAALQAYMIWRLPSEQARMWIVFGGQFYLSALMVGLFYFKFPEKFKWGICRYVFLFIGASSFCDTYLFWKKVKHGVEPLPYGSMVNGEEDASGDMDTLSADLQHRPDKVQKLRSAQRRTERHLGRDLLRGEGDGVVSDEHARNGYAHPNFSPPARQPNLELPPRITRIHAYDLEWAVRSAPGIFKGYRGSAEERKKLPTHPPAVRPNCGLVYPGRFSNIGPHAGQSCTDHCGVACAWGTQRPGRVAPTLPHPVFAGLRVAAAHRQDAEVACLLSGLHVAAQSAAAGRLGRILVSHAARHRALRPL